MNKRIRELALKAKLGGAEFDNGIRYYVGTAESFEKFAELIVRECIAQCNDGDSRWFIAQHFRIEE